MLTTFAGSLQCIDSLVFTDNDLLSVRFNSNTYIIRRRSFCEVSVLIKEIFESSSECEMEITLEGVSTITFEKLLHFFNSGFIQTSLGEDVCLIETLVLADYLQCSLLNQFCCMNLNMNWNKTINKQNFHHTTLPYHIFSNLITQMQECTETKISDDQCLQAWTNFAYVNAFPRYCLVHGKHICTCDTKKGRDDTSLFEPTPQCALALSSIDLEKCSITSLKAAQFALPPKMLSHLNCSGLIRKLVSLNEKLNHKPKHAFMPN